MDLDKKLKKLRINHYLSQDALAEKLGVSRQAVSKWESGASFPDIENLIWLSELYCVTLDYLMKEEEKEDIIERII